MSAAGHQQTSDPGHSKVLEAIARYNQQGTGLIALLERIQTMYGYLPKNALLTVAEETSHSFAEIYGVATFYSSFNLEPCGKHLVNVCLGTACHVRGAPEVAKEFEKQLGVQPGKKTEDGEFTQKNVNCLGACALGPIVVVDGRYHPHFRTSLVKKTLDDARRGEQKIELDDERIFPVEARCPRCNHSLMDPDNPIDGYPSVRLTISFGEVHTSLRISALWGSYTTVCKEEIPDGIVVMFFCSKCHASLRGTSPCPECEAPMAPLFVAGGGLARICTRSGCTGHMLDLGENIVE